MPSGPFLGVLLHAIGGVGHGTFYAPLHRVRGWAWESFWLVQGVAAWVLTPWIVAFAAQTNPVQVLQEAPTSSIVWSYIFGAMWGMGSLTFGLTMRYLGMSLGMAVALGFTAAFGTLIPPIFEGEFATLASTTSGQIIFLGVAVCLLGIAGCGYAGMLKERELTEEEKRAGVREFALGRGLLIATFSGIMSAGFAYGIQAGQPIAETAFELGAPSMFRNAPTFILVMGGGFTINFIWCVALNVLNRSGGDYMNANTPRLNNYFYASIAGIIWYLGFMLYGMGTTQMGEYDFSSWSIHLAFVILFSTLAGVLLREWKGVSTKAYIILAIGMIILVASTLITAAGNELAN